MTAAGAERWIAARPRWARGALAVGGGLALGLGHSPYEQPWTALLALPLLFLLFRGAPTVRRAALTGWMAGVGYFGLTLSWIIDPFLVDPERHGWMAPFAVFFMAAGMALFWALAFGAARRLAPPHRLGQLCVLAACLALTGLLRSHVLTGFPWALPAYAWAGTPVGQVAALLGPHGLGFLVLALGLLPGLMRPGAVLAGVAGIGLLWAGGAYRLQTTEVQPSGTVVRLVQPNAAQHLKWKAEMVPVFFQRQLAATSAPPDGPPPDIIVWPETAVPFLLGDRPDLHETMAAAAGDGTWLAFGITRIDDDDRWFNSLAVIDDGGALAASYDKHHLVPFGEYMPLSHTLRALGLDWLTRAFVGSGFSSGPGPARIALPGVPAFQPLICYEAIFPHEILSGAERPDWLLQVTNDAWFGLWSGPYQHLAQARMRAIEQGLPLARSANTGISAMIDPLGRVTAMLPLAQAGHADAMLPAALTPTPYSRTGDLPALVVLLTIIAAAGLAARRGRRTAAG